MLNKHVRSIRSNPIMATVLLLVCLTFGQIAVVHSVGENKRQSVALITESIHITAADGQKSLGQLIREQSNVAVPEQAIASLRFLVSPFAGDLIFPNVPEFQPAGFDWGIRAGEDKLLKVQEAPLPATQALEFFPAKTKTVCNFIITVEFFPARNDDRRN